VKFIRASAGTSELRPVKNWNRGKKEEFKDRQNYDPNSRFKKKS